LFGLLDDDILAGIVSIERSINYLLSNKTITTDPPAIFKTPPTISPTFPYDLELEFVLSIENVSNY